MPADVSVSRERINALKQRLQRDVASTHGDSRELFNELSVELGKMYDESDPMTQQTIMLVYRNAEQMDNINDAYAELMAGAQALTNVLDERLADAEQEIQRLRDPVRMVALQVDDNMVLPEGVAQHFVWMLATGNLPYEFCEEVETFMTQISKRSQELVA